MWLLAFIALQFVAALFVKRDPNVCHLSFLGPLFAGAGALAKGVMDRNATKKANEANRPINQVREWEEAGINPIFGISSGGFIPHRAASMGDAFAQAGGQFARFFDMKHEEELRETALKKENQALRKEMDSLVKPRQPGHLQQNSGILPLPSEGGSNEKSGGNHDPLADDETYHTSPDSGLVQLRFPEGNTTVPIGPDIDEVVMGWVGQTHARIKSERRAGITRRHLIHTGQLRDGPRTRPVTTRKERYDRLTDGQKAYKKVKRNKRGY